MLPSGVCHRISSEKLKFYFFLPKCTFLKLWPRWTEFLPAELMLSSSCVHASCVTEPVSNESHFPYTKAHANPKCDRFLRLCFHFITTHQNTISTVWMIHGGSTEITVNLLLDHHSRRMRETLLPMAQSYSLPRSGKMVRRNSTFESWLPESQIHLMWSN